jgi:hypothetical protein
MDPVDPEKRIAELERQLAEQYAIAESERQRAKAEMPWAAPRPPVSPPSTPYGTDSGGSSGGLSGLGPSGASFKRWQHRRPLRSLWFVWFLIGFWVIMIPLGYGLSVIMSHFTP